jgi:hypothetical protein
MEKIKSIDSVKELESIENAYNLGGINAVIEWIENNFPIGTIVNLNQGIPDEKIYRICNRAIHKLDDHGKVSDFAYLNSIDGVENCNTIRILALTYVAEPFQIELYGTDANVEK